MSIEEQVKVQLTLKVLKRCEQYGIDDADSAPYVKELLAKVPSHYRPTEVGVLTSVKRKLWGLTELDSGSDK